jgi:diguanylate cyclase (GGDEF)-like protein
MNEALERLAGTKDLDQTVQIFVEALSRSMKNVPIAYFKYVPAHMSLLFSQSAWLPNEKFRGLGLDLKKEQARSAALLNDRPGEMTGLREMVREVFHKDHFTAFTHVSEGEALGVFIVLSDVDIENSVTTNIFRRAFELAYKRNQTIKEKHLLDLTDPLTGLVNRKQFGVRMEQEMARSRRILMPVSLITLDVDGFTELNQRLGAQQADSVLKTVGMILKRTTRLNDILARTGPDEFACLLPHTGYEGAAIKAERLRILLESTKIPLLEGMGLGPLRVSVGVSEYPSFCSDGEGLIQTADEALSQVRQQGGNKICLATAPSGFQMDFQPRSTGDSSQFGVRVAR